MCSPVTCVVLCVVAMCRGVMGTWRQPVACVYPGSMHRIVCTVTGPEHQACVRRRGRGEQVPAQHTRELERSRRPFPRRALVSVRGLRLHVPAGTAGEAVGKVQHRHTPRPGAAGYGGVCVVWCVGGTEGGGMAGCRHEEVALRAVRCVVLVRPHWQRVEMCGDCRVLACGMLSVGVDC